MSLLPPKIRGSFIVTLILAVACFCSYADAAKAKTKKKAKPKVEKPKTAQVDTNKVIIEANDPKAFTKAILLDKKGVDFEVVGEQKNKSPQLVVKEKKSEDFFDFSTMLIPITHKAPLGSRYGVRDHRLHRGVDVSIIRDEPVVAAFPGTVVVSKYNQGGYGHYVLVEHENGLSTLYGHLSERLVKVGEKVYPAISSGWRAIPENRPARTFISRSVTAKSTSTPKPS